MDEIVWWVDGCPAAPDPWQERAPSAPQLSWVSAEVDDWAARRHPGGTDTVRPEDWPDD